VSRVPCYTFHDGFSAYRHLLDGVLPLSLKPISRNDSVAVTRFFNACIGWVRYKPLLLFITNAEDYLKNIENMRATLTEVLPHICTYFDRKEFMQIIVELDKYSRNVKKHYTQFIETQSVWKKVLSYRKYWL